MLDICKHNGDISKNYDDNQFRHRFGIRPKNLWTMSNSCTKIQGPRSGLWSFIHWTGRYDDPWLFDLFKDEDGTRPVWIWKIDIIIPIFTFSIMTVRDSSWSYHVTDHPIDTKRVKDLSANPRWVISVHEKTNRTKTLEMVLCENLRPSVNFPTL